MTSGVGVSIAAKRNAANITHFSIPASFLILNFFILLISNKIIGSWNNNAKPRRYLLTKEMYDSVVIKAVKLEGESFCKKNKLAGSATKYENRTPIISKRTDPVRTLNNLGSLSGNAGLMKLMASSINTGRLVINPNIIANDKTKLNPPAGDV